MVHSRVHKPKAPVVATRSATAAPRAAQRIPTAEQWQQRSSDQREMARALTPRLPAAAQAKLAIGASDDPLEHEADRIAEQVMRMPVSDSITAAPLQISRQCAACDAEADWLQRTGHDTAGSEHAAPNSVREVLREPGVPLDPATRGFFEQRFGRDFAAVRIHDGAAAQASAREVNARAYTVGHDIVLGAGSWSAATFEGRRLLAHELTHVVQQTAAGSPVGGVVQREEDPNAAGALSEVDRRRVDYIYRKSWELLTGLRIAQDAHTSVLRSQWSSAIENDVLSAIPAIEADRNQIEAVAALLQRHTDAIEASVRRYRSEWQALESRYLSEHDWLARQGFDDAKQAAKQLERWYEESKGWLDRGALAYITDEDYGRLKLELGRSGHIAVGTLRASRDRVRQLAEVLDAVAELRIDGDDANKYVPGWQAQVQTELDNLERLTRTPATPGYDYPAEFARLRTELAARLEATLKTKKRERPMLGKAIDFVTGVADAVVGPLVEAAKQAWDLVQIAVHFASFGKYEPKLQSDMAEAARQGASTTDLLKGMVTGLLETPQRFVEAIEKGDWEAIGREAANLYVLARAIRHAPEHFSKMPGLVAKTQRGLRVLRARALAGRMNQPRLAPAAVPRIPFPEAAPRILTADPLAPTRAPAPVQQPPNVSGGNRIGATAGSTGGTTNARVPSVNSPDVKVGGFGRRSDQVPDAPRADRKVGGFARNGEPAQTQSASDVKVGGFARRSDQVPQAPSADRKVPGFGRKREPAPDTSDGVPVDNATADTGRISSPHGVPRASPTDITRRNTTAPELPPDLKVGGFARDAQRGAPDLEPPAPKKVRGFEPQRDAVPEPISNSQVTQRNPAPPPNAKIEQIGEFKVFGNKQLEGGVLHRRIVSFTRDGGPTRDIRPLLRFVSELSAEAIRAGAKVLRITGEFVENPNVMRLRRFVEAFGGTVKRVDAKTIDIVIPLVRPRR